MHGPRKEIGRSSPIRTDDPLLPKQMRYRAALYSEAAIITLDRTSSGSRNRSRGVAGRRSTSVLEQLPKLPLFRQPTRPRAIAMGACPPPMRVHDERIARCSARHDDCELVGAGRGGRLRLAFRGAGALHLRSADHPLTQMTCFSVCTTSTRSLWFAMTSSMSLYAPGISSMTPLSFRHSTPAVCATTSA